MTSSTRSAMVKSVRNTWGPYLPFLKTGLSNVTRPTETRTVRVCTSGHFRCAMRHAVARFEESGLHPSGPSAGQQDMTHDCPSPRMWKVGSFSGVRLCFVHGLCHFSLSLLWAIRHCCLHLKYIPPQALVLPEILSLSYISSKARSQKLRYRKTTNRCLQ